MKVIKNSQARLTRTKKLFSRHSSLERDAEPIFLNLQLPKNFPSLASLRAAHELHGLPQIITFELLANSIQPLAIE